MAVALLALVRARTGRPRKFDPDLILTTTTLTNMPAAIAFPPPSQRQFAVPRTPALAHGCARGRDGRVGRHFAAPLVHACHCASDRLWDTPPWLRAIVRALAGWAGFVFFAMAVTEQLLDLGAGRSIRAIWRSLSQQRYRRLGDRLLGIVELADPDAHPSTYSAGTLPRGHCAGGGRGLVVRFPGGGRRIAQAAALVPRRRFSLSSRCNRRGHGNRRAAGGLE